MLRVLLLLCWIVPAAAQPKGWPPMPQDAMQLLLKRDIPGSLAVLRALAETGDGVAMFWLGRCLEEAEGVPHDYAAAMDWYRKSAQQGVGVAAWSAGRLHEMGRGAPRDPDEAQKWYEAAAKLGFLRTALTVVKARWYPGSGALEYQPVPEALRNPQPHLNPDLAFLDGPPPDITPGELDVLRKAGLRGRLVWQGSERGMFGLPARVILIARERVREEVRLRLPGSGSVLYVQKDVAWERFGNAGRSERSLRIYPQSPETPWITAVEVEMEDGGTQRSSAWNWAQP